MSNVTGHTRKLAISDGIGWVRRGDGLLHTALPCEYIEEIEALHGELRTTLAWLKERMPCTSGKCCEDIRARIAALEALTDETNLTGEQR